MLQSSLLVPLNSSIVKSRQELLLRLIEWARKNETTVERMTFKDMVQALQELYT
jgi:hypothetical protein